MPMRRNAAQPFAFFAFATCRGLACAADPGDPTKTLLGASPGSSSSGFSASSSGSTSSGSSSGFMPSSSSSSSSSSGAGGSSSGGNSSGSSSGSGGSGADAGSDAPAGPACVTNGKSAAISYDTQDTAASTAKGSITFNVVVTNDGLS